MLQAAYEPRCCYLITEQIRAKRNLFVYYIQTLQTCSSSNIFQVFGNTFHAWFLQSFSTSAQFFEAFNCLNKLTNIFETLHHDGQIKETITTEKAERFLSCNSLLCFGGVQRTEGHNRTCHLNLANHSSHNMQICSHCLHQSNTC